MITEKGINFFSYDEAATKLGTSKAYLYTLITAGKLKSYKLGVSRKRYLTEHDINAFSELPDNTALSAPSFVPAPIDVPNASATYKVTHEGIQALSMIANDIKAVTNNGLEQAATLDELAFKKALERIALAIIQKAFLLLTSPDVNTLTGEQFIEELVNAVPEMALLSDDRKQQLITQTKTLGDAMYEDYKQLHHANHEMSA